MTSAPPFPSPNIPPRISSEPEIDLRGLMMILWRRRVLILGLLLVLLSLVAIVLSFIQPRYKAKSLVHLNNPVTAGGSPELQALAGLTKRDNTMILSEIEIVRSRGLAQHIVMRLNLLADPGFNPRFAAHKNAALNGNFKTARLPPEIAQRDMDAVVTNFLKYLDARAIPGSNVMQISYLSPDPTRAAFIANAVADAYIAQRLENKMKSSRRVSSWLDRRLEELREQVRMAAQNVADYRAQHDLNEGVRGDMAGEQFSQLNAQLINAQTRQAELQARLAQLKHLSGNAGELQTAAEIINSGLIQKLKLNEAALQQEISDLSARYGPRHPEMIKRVDELRDLRETMAAEMDVIAASVASELKVAGARVAGLKDSLARLQSERHSEGGAIIRLHELQDEARTSRQIFENFLETYKRSAAQDELQESGAQIISYAAAPAMPAYPNKRLILALTAIAGLFAGVSLSFLFEKMDNNFRSAGQLEAALGFPCFALIPKVANLTGKAAADYILARPASVAAEAIRTLRTVLGLRGKEKGGPKVVTVTSSFPGEGKTTLSAWLGRMAAKSGEKVIIIDADLRRPKIHHSFGQKNTLSLVDYLTGEKTLEEIVQIDERSGLHILYGRAVPGSALQLIGGARMEKLVAALRQSYDLVIIDSPACMAVSDARILATLSDQLLYAVAWEETPRAIVAGGVKQFTDLDFEKIGFILTNVDVQKHVRYGYGDTVYYYGRNDKYS